MGYPRLAEQMLIAKNMDPETDTVSRADLWKAARCDDNGIYADDKTSKMAKRIDTIKEQISKGIIKPTGREDALSLALEKDEHPGRLRGVGFGVGVKRYFGPNKQAHSSSQRERILEAKLEQVLQRVGALEKQLNLESQGSIPRPQVSAPRATEEQEYQSPILNHASSMIDSPHVDSSKFTENPKCKLFWPDRTSEVANGRAFVPKAGVNTLLHGTQLGTSTLKVTIDKIVKENADVPYPTEEVPFLSNESLGNIIAWPKEMVIFESDFTESSKGVKKALFQPHVSKSFATKPKHHTIDRCMSLIASIDDFSLKIDMPKDVVQHSHKLEVYKEDLLSWLARGELDGVHISLYIKYFYDKYNSTQFKFLCPSRVAYLARNSDNLKLDYRVRYMVASMRQESECLWFLPYHEGYHWMLAVINPALNLVYWLDPLLQDVRDNFKEMCEVSLTMISSKRGNLQDVDKPKISWNLIKCPEQPDRVSCGLYICRFMKDIIKSGVTQIPSTYLPDSPSSYSEDHIAEVVEECVEYIQPILQLELNSPKHRS